MGDISALCTFPIRLTARRQTFLSTHEKKIPKKVAFLQVHRNYIQLLSSWELHYTVPAER